MDLEDVSVLHPQTRRHLLNNQRLRDAAIREFAQHGLHGAKVGNIVAAAQLTQPSFYRMWPSKAQAFDEIVEQTVTQWLQVAAGILSRPESCPLSIRIQSGLEQLFDCLLRDPPLTQMVISVKHHNEEMHDRFLTAYTGAIGQAQEQGYVTSEQEARSLALAYYGLVEQFFYAHLYQKHRETGSTIKTLAHLIFLVMKKETST